MINIPIFRAKKTNSDEYVEGDLFYEKYIIAKSKLNTLIADAINHIEYDILKNECINENCKIEHTQLKDMLNKLILNERFEHIYEIDPSTLAIHFPDMLDSQGNKIFASLSEDGKGGDIVKTLVRPVNNFQEEKILENVIIFDLRTYNLHSIIISKVENYNSIDISYLIQYRKNISTQFEVIGIQE